MVKRRRKQKFNAKHLAVRQKSQLDIVIDDAKHTMVNPIEKAKAEFHAKVKSFMRVGNDGVVSWNPAKYKQARAEFARVSAHLESSLAKSLDHGTKHAMDMAASHFEQRVGKTVDRASAISKATPAVKRQTESIATRFGSSRGTHGVGASLQREFGHDIMTAKPVDGVLKRALQLSRHAMGTAEHRAKEFSSIEKSAKAVSDGFFGMFEHWAQRIVKTELASAYEHTHSKAMKQHGGVKEKIWVAEEGCCEYCAALEDQIVPIDDSFVDDEGDDVDPPAHPNCMCSAWPYSEKTGDTKGEELSEE